MSADRFPCPCCGYLVFDAPPGSYDICLICFWEDDPDQLRWPNLAQAANVVSLREAQQSYAKVGAIEERFAGDVRAPTAEEARDPGFRLLEPGDPVETEAGDVPGPTDTTELYYWRPTFWRRSEAG